MSAEKKRRSRKRTNKAGGTEVRGVQGGESQDGVQQEGVSQQASQGNPEEDRTNKQGGSIMSEQNTGYQPKPSLKDRLGLTKETLIHIAMAVIIAVIISALVSSQINVSGGTYDADMARMEQGITTMGANVADNAMDIADLQDDLGTINAQYGGVANTVGLHTGSIEAQGTRLTTLEGNVSSLWDDFAAVCSPPEAHLTGNFTTGNLTIHAEASSNGTYTANVHLVFATAVVNWTATVNWTAANVKAYVPVATYNGTDWLTTGAWWNIGTFALAADTEKDINVLFGGLADTVSFTYVEIYPALE